MDMCGCTWCRKKFGMKRKLRITKKMRWQWGIEGYHSKVHARLQATPTGIWQPYLALLPGIRVTRCVTRCALLVYDTPVGHPFSMKELMAMAGGPGQEPLFFFARLESFYTHPNSKRAQNRAARLAFAALAKGGE